MISSLVIVMKPSKFIDLRIQGCKLTGSVLIDLCEQRHIVSTAL